MRRHAFAVVPTVLVFASLVLADTAAAWTWPTGGAVVQPFSFDHAHPYAAGQHRGIDVSGAEGEPVAAPASGSVSFAGTVPGSGRSVTIDTPDGYAVTLTHLGSISVARGAAVSEGAAVGAVGATADAEVAGLYVHLGVRLEADEQGYVDPMGLLPARAAPEPPAVASPTPAPAAEPAPSPVAAPPPPAVSPASDSTTVATPPVAPPATVPAPEPQSRPASGPAVSPRAAPHVARRPAAPRAHAPAAAHVAPAADIVRAPRAGASAAPRVSHRSVAPQARRPLPTRPRTASPRPAHRVSVAPAHSTRPAVTAGPPRDHVVLRARARRHAEPDRPRAHPVAAPKSVDRPDPAAVPAPHSVAVARVARRGIAGVIVVALFCAAAALAVAGVCALRLRRPGALDPVRIIAPSVNSAEDEDPGCAGLAVCGGIPAPWARSGVRAVRRVRALPPAQRQRRARGEWYGRARHTGDGRRRPRGEVLP
jgi:hypothetical protein